MILFIEEHHKGTKEEGEPELLPQCSPHTVEEMKGVIRDNSLKFPTVLGV